MDYLRKKIATGLCALLLAGSPSLANAQKSKKFEVPVSAAKVSRLFDMLESSGLESFDSCGERYYYHEFDCGAGGPGSSCVVRSYGRGTPLYFEMALNMPDSILFQRFLVKEMRDQKYNIAGVFEFRLDMNKSVDDFSFFQDAFTQGCPYDMKWQASVGKYSRFVSESDAKDISRLIGRAASNLDEYASAQEKE